MVNVTPMRWGKRRKLRQRVALMERLLYTMRPEVMAEGEEAVGRGAI